MIGIISDIHGNAPALRTVIQKLDSYGCERIISLGDVAGYYCLVNECIDLLRSKNVMNIMGNHDHYLLSNTSCLRSTSANICLDYQRSVISDYNLEWLRQSLPVYDTHYYSARHGGWNDRLDEYIQDFDFNDAKEYSQRIFISGHTHIQKMQAGDDGKIYFNPGSVGQPRDGDNRAAFAVIYDNGEIALQRVNYDVDEIVHAMNKAGFDDRMSACLYKGVKIGGEIA